MKCQMLFSGKNKKSIISLTSAEFAQRMVMVEGPKSVLIQTVGLFTQPSVNCCLEGITGLDQKWHPCSFFFQVCQENVVGKSQVW